MAWIECEQGPGILVTTFEGGLIVISTGGPDNPVMTAAEARRLAAELVRVAGSVEAESRAREDIPR